jgi:hypothetical protein
LTRASEAALIYWVDGLDFAQNKPCHLLVHFPAAFFEKIGKAGKIQHPICLKSSKFKVICYAYHGLS